MIYSIGELINRIKISRRTLHYYDEIGLLKPTISRENGYRYYDESAVLKLQTILSLKSMDFSLDEIKELFDTTPETSDTPDDPWMPLLQMQIDQATRKIDDLKRKQFILRSVSHTLVMSGKRVDEDIFQLMKKIESPHFVEGEIPATFPKEVFSDDEIRVLERLPLIGSEDPRVAETIHLIKQTRSAMHKGIEQAEEDRLAHLWANCISKWFDGDLALQNKYFTFIDSASKEKPIVFGLDDEVIRFIDQLMNTTQQREESEHES
ncbi:MerR family transcriptional regulator [Aureibacillus halotolerans]|uniref:DNA-binding transcriptional MerR regulator n=1 Tax=Aureibacillus halotolerans TaxID=1508390 RepID=A0A4R6UBB5_9BACI|nr:MerR family transcriptional regulator [Aureibacillus halotolerans]TDQ40384.1 DNA-binding transcriptional MerR regulator [Aureibacillus halotolerans]